MEKIIPVFYSEYGRYISRFRMIPLNIDCLLPVERRTLLTMHRIASRSLVKSFKIDGAVIGDLHPHGSAYSTLVNLVRNGFADSESSTWGGIGLKDCDAPAARYCVVGDTIIQSDRENFKIKDLFSEYEITEKTKQFKLNLKDVNVLTAKNEYRNVSHAWYSGYQETFEVKTEDGEYIICTENHPFLVEGKVSVNSKATFWVECKNLNVGTEVIKYKDNKMAPVKIISITPNGKDFVFDLTVPELHSFVGNNFVVHNTETKLEPWVSKFAFEYIDYVPWEFLELDTEPLYLPSILPLGLIGDGIITGIAFHKAVIPKYTAKDLATRLLWLLQNGQPKPPKNYDAVLNEKKYGPVIKPNKTDCDLEEINKNDFYKLFLSGEGSVLYKPKVYEEIIEVKRDGKIKKINTIVISGRAPNATFKSLLSDYEKNKLPLISAPIDQSKGMNIHISLEVKKNINTSEFIEMLSEKYLNRAVHFKTYMCDLNGAVNQTPIDTLLLNCFHNWQKAFVNKLVGSVEIVNKKIIESYICSFIKDQIKNKINNIDDILKKWSKKNSVKIYKLKDAETYDIVEIEYFPTTEDITTIYNRTPIRRLVEWQTTENENRQEIGELKNQFDNLQIICEKRITEILGDKTLNVRSK